MIAVEQGIAPPETFCIEVDAGGAPINPRGPIRDTTDLQASIKEAGRIIEPILVARDADGRLWVRNGHRRVTAARILAIDVPYVVVGDDGRTDALDLMLASNVRQAFPDIVLDKSGAVIGGLARAVADKLAGGARTRESLARLMGMRPDVVSAYERLVAAPVDVRRAVAAGRLSITGFARMKHAPADVQQEIVAGDEAVPVTAVRDGLRRARRERQPQLDGATPDEASTVQQLNAIANSLRAILSQPLGPREKILIKQIHSITEEV